MWVVIVVIVIVAAVWFFMMPNSSAPQGQGTPAPTSQNAPAAPVVQNTPTPAPAAQGALQTAPTDDSNSALNQDLDTINNQLNGLASDSASIDQGLNDQPVTQGQ